MSTMTSDWPISDESNSKNVVLGNVFVAADGRRRFQSKAADEDGEPIEEQPRLRGEQLVTPIDHRAHRCCGAGSTFAGLPLARRRRDRGDRRSPVVRARLRVRPLTPGRGASRRDAGRSRRRAFTFSSVSSKRVAAARTRSTKRATAPYFAASTAEGRLCLGTAREGIL